MNVEFFHSVLCTHCFIMSDRMRKIVAKYPKIKITHRSYPLRWDDSDEHKNFQSKKEFNEDMEKKWVIANKIDDDHRFNIEGMKQADFEMPTARLAMIAIRAASLAGGDEWELFDRFQHALYVENRNIGDEEVIADIITEAGVDFAAFLKFYEDPATEALELDDFNLAEKYDFETIPALVVEGKHIISGTKRIDLAINLLKEAAEKEGISL